MKLSAIVSTLAALAGTQAIAAHWVLVSVSSPSTVTWTESGPQGVPASSKATDSAAISGAAAVFGTQSINYYGYNTDCNPGKVMAMQFTTTDAATAPMVFTFEYVFDSPGDPTLTVGDNYQAGFYNLRLDAAASTSPVTDFTITGSCTFGHQLPASNTFEIDQNSGPGGIGTWPGSGDPTLVVGASGAVYDFTSSTYGTNPITETDGNYYAVVDVPFNVQFIASLAASQNGMVYDGLMRITMSDTDIVGFGQIWNFPVEY